MSSEADRQQIVLLLDEELGDEQFNNSDSDHPIADHFLMGTRKRCFMCRRRAR